jgi:light-regulated signal transduction histidine kinase (bacteriophytochrome)
MKIILDGANRMEQLINGLLRYAALGQDRPPNAPVCMNGVVTAAISDLQHSITESGAQIKFSDLPTVQGDPIQLLQLLQNLITNGIKYRNASLPPVIQIAAIHDGRSWKFSVKDNGQGISPEYHALIFGLLKRLHGNDVPGTGLGLAICKKIVEQHGGRIWVESQAGAGSTFFFTIPA